MKVEDWPIEELQPLAAQIRVLEKIGVLLEQAGFVPTFDMVPGREVSIRTGIELAFEPHPSDPVEDAAPTPEPTDALRNPTADEAARDAPAVAEPAGADADTVPAEVPAVGDPVARDGLTSMRQYLRDLPRGAMWTLERDLSLMGLACLGWNTQEIACELEVSEMDVKARFNTLTGKRRFKRDAVLVVLDEMVHPKAVV